MTGVLLLSTKIDHPALKSRENLTLSDIFSAEGNKGYVASN